MGFGSLRCILDVHTNVQLSKEVIQCHILTDAQSVSLSWCLVTSRKTA
jgi:hypothetical protein